MRELGLLSSKPFRKCARVVGEVLGKFHPHGDTAVYDALVRLAQVGNAVFFLERFTMCSKKCFSSLFFFAKTVLCSWFRCATRFGMLWQAFKSVVHLAHVSSCPSQPELMCLPAWRGLQDFTMRSPLVSGHGNFGSIDADPPAAMRYTECKLQLLSEKLLLEDIDGGTVDFVANFDGSAQEPSVLPAKLPHLLLNGAQGIAVSGCRPGHYRSWSQAPAQSRSL
jgi:hypothetical protein